jgi:hypothetical protein
MAWQRQQIPSLRRKLLLFLRKKMMMAQTIFHHLTDTTIDPLAINYRARGRVHAALLSISGRPRLQNLSIRSERILRME